DERRPDHPIVFDLLLELGDGLGVLLPLSLRLGDRQFLLQHLDRLGEAFDGLSGARPLDLPDVTPPLGEERANALGFLPLAHLLEEGVLDALQFLAELLARSLLLEPGGEGLASVHALHLQAAGQLRRERIELLLQALAFPLELRLLLKGVAATDHTSPGLLDGAAKLCRRHAWGGQVALGHVPARRCEQGRGALPPAVEARFEALLLLPLALARLPQVRDSLQALEALARRFGPRRPRPIDPAEQLGTGRPPSRLGRHPGAARLLLPRAGGLPGCAGRSGRALSLLDRSHEVVVSIPPLAVAFERHRRSLDLA